MGPFYIEKVRLPKTIFIISKMSEKKRIRRKIYTRFIRFLVRESLVGDQEWMSPLIPKEAVKGFRWIERVKR